MKITLEHYGIKIEASVPNDDLTLDQVTSLFTICLHGAGFSAQTIEERFPEADAVRFDHPIKAGVA